MHKAVLKIHVLLVPAFIFYNKLFISQGSGLALFVCFSSIHLILCLK